MKVELVAGGKVIHAEVVFQSWNGRSLMLEFDDTVWVGTADRGGRLFGMMPVFRRDDGTWVEVLHGGQVTVRFIEEG